MHCAWLNGMEQSSPVSKVMLYQNVGFITIIVLIFLNELLALPSLIFGDSAFITDFRESTLKMLLVLMVWFLVSGSTRRFLVHVRYLEGFMRVCAWCHRIDYKGNWVTMEDFLQRSFDTPTTHGICPVCLEKQEAALLRSKQEREAHSAGDSTQPQHS